jgi:hypothetical protein
VRALRFQLCQQGGNVAAEGCFLLALGHRETCKTARENRNREEHLDHAATPLLSCLARALPKPDEFAASRRLQKGGCAAGDKARHEQNQARYRRAWSKPLLRGGGSAGAGLVPMQTIRPTTGPGRYLPILSSMALAARECATRRVSALALPEK